MEDEGRPLGIGFQERVSNQSKLLRSRGVVVSVGSKVRSRIRAGEHPRDERERTLDHASKLVDVAKTRGGSILWDKSVGDLITGRAATGVEGA